MGSISRGFRLAKASWGVVRKDRQLLWLPVISFLCSLVVIAVFGLGALGIGIPEEGQSPSPALYVLGFFFYVVLAFVTIYFNAAVIATAMKRLRGEPGTIRDGLAVARSHIGTIFVWAMVTATVGMILRWLQERFGWVGRIVIGFIGVAWSVVTFFVLPVLIFEDLGVTDGVKRSASLFRQRWGEQLVGNATISIALMIIAIPIGLVGGALAFAVPVVGIPVLVVAFGILIAVGAACSGVFNAALYEYATTGNASGAFSLEDMNSSFRRKGGRRGIFGGSGSQPLAATPGWTPPAGPGDQTPTRPD